MTLPLTYPINILYCPTSVNKDSGACRCVVARKQTDQTTTLCVQEVEIYLERWEVLGALVDVCRARATPNTNREQTLFQVFHDIEGS